MKTIEEIYQELAEEFRRRTGLAIGSSGDLAVRFYAVAAQLYGLYVQAEWTGKQCFPQTAAGEALDLHAQLRGVSRRPAAKAAGTVRFYAGADRGGAAEVPVGTVCMTAEGRRFVTVEAGTIPAGETELDLAVEAVEAGSGGNVAAGGIIFLAVPPDGVTACTNPGPVTGGRDDEEDESLRGRVMDTYRRLANGANAAFYEQTAMNQEGVATVVVLPRNRGVGTVDVVVAAHEGMPGEELLVRVQDTLDSAREIAVDVQVLAPTAARVDLSVTLTAARGHSFEQVSKAVEERVEGWFTGGRLGSPVLQAELTALVFGTAGVANCTVTLEGGDLAADAVTLPCLGRLTVTNAVEEV